jgi:hypothetical protein
MNVVAIACVRDEVDIVEAFVRHTVAAASRLIVLDNGSTDGTREVLASLCAEGLPLDVVDDPSPGKYLAERLTRLMRDHAVARYDAQWILPLDADELVDWGTTTSLDASREAPLLVQWRSYVPHETDAAAERNPVVRMRHRLAEEPDGLWKVIVPGQLARHPGAAIVQGSHAVEIDGQRVPDVRRSDIRLAHFPVRSLAQFVGKTVIGHLQNEVMPFRDTSWGWHHRDHYERLKDDPDAFAAGLGEMARRYSRQPVNATPVALVEDRLRYRGGALRYTPSSEALSAWPPVLRYVQDLARKYALLSGTMTGEERLAFDEESRVRRFLIDQLADRDRTMLELREQNERVNAAIDHLRGSWRWRAGGWIVGSAHAARRGWQMIRRGSR